MARVHTDFIVMSEDVYDMLLALLPNYVRCTVLYDIAPNKQLYTESKLHKKGLRVLKRQYVK